MEKFNTKGFIMNDVKEPVPLVIISSSPHIHSGSSISSSMKCVLVSLVPTLLASIYYFRLNAILLVVSCVISAMVFEALCQKIMQRPVAIKDGSAALTGLLLAFCLPPSLPLGLGIFGSFCAIVIGKQVFGGLGNNLFNPAHLARAILLASFPQQMTTWISPVATKAINAVTHATGSTDAISAATPLSMLRHSESIWLHGESAINELPSLWDLFMGSTGGSLGETCVPALLLGGLFLIFKKIIDWRIPFFYLATVLLITFTYGYIRQYDSLFALYHLFSGGLIIGAFFMATDWVTSPITKRGRIVYAIGLGLLTSLIRLRGSYIEGVCYSILIMNMLTPLIDRYVHTVPFGGGAKHED